MMKKILVIFYLLILIATIFAFLEINFFQSIGFGLHRVVIVTFPLIAPIFVVLPILYSYKTIRAFNRTNGISLIALNVLNYIILIAYIRFVWIELFNMAMSV